MSTAPLNRSEMDAEESGHPALKDVFKLLKKEIETPALQAIEPSAVVSGTGLDVVFPVLHGPYGEDGTVQGLLELAEEELAALRTAAEAVRGKQDEVLGLLP